MNAVVRSEVTLPATGKRLAVRAIEAVFAAYSAKGGLRETLELAETQAAGISRHIYSIATNAAKHHKRIGDAAAEFSALCMYAENTFKSKHQVENLRDAVPVWNVFKSNILRGMRLELSPLDAANERAFRTKTMEAVAAKRGLAVTSDAEDDDTEAADEEGVVRITTRAGPQPMETIEQFVATTTVRDTLKVLVAQVIFSCEHIKPSKADEAAAILQRAWSELGPLVSKRALQ